jgi:hypothetical protein
MLNSLEFRQVGDGIESVRRILGVTVSRKSMRRADFVDFEKSSSMQTQSGGKHVMHYSVYAVDWNRRKLVVGEGFKGAGQADAAAKLFGREFALVSVSKKSDRPTDGALDLLGPDRESIA